MQSAYDQYEAGRAQEQADLEQKRREARKATLFIHFRDVGEPVAVRVSDLAAGVDALCLVRATCVERVVVQLSDGIFFTVKVGEHK